MTVLHQASSSRRGNWFASPRRRAIVLAVALVMATVALYSPARHHPFVNFDDDAYVTENVNVKSGLSWDTMAWAFTSFYASNWHPLTWLSHALDCQFFGLDPGGHHDTSILWHALNAVLLYWVLLRATGYAGRSFMVAALFALHPINVESVAWIAERKNLLSMTFFLLALAAYGRYARKPQVGRYLVVALLFACGLMAKPQVITLPFVLLLWDYWPLGRMSAEDQPTPAGAATRAGNLGSLVLEKVPLFALSVASAIVTVIAQHESGAMSGPHWQPLGIRIENAIVDRKSTRLNSSH